MITVLNAGALHGYSGVDHLIDDQTSSVVGRQFRSVGEALQAADRKCFIDAYGDRPRRYHPYTWVEVRFASGEVRTFRSVGDRSR